jgi:hypothetical protein
VAGRRERSAGQEAVARGAAPVLREGGPAGGVPGPRALVLASLAACAGFALFGKVLSPQFVIWVLPLGALAFAWRMHALAAVVALVALLTQIEFPAHYFDVVDGAPLAVGLVALRNIALAAVIALSLRDLVVMRRATRGEPAVAR